MKPLGSTGKAGRIGDVHIDVITDVRKPTRYTRTDSTLETGAPVSLHRRRDAASLAVTVVVSDVEPFVLATAIGLWEKDHAEKTRDRIEALAESGEEVEFYDGQDFRRTPAGQKVWVVDEIDPTTNVLEEGVWRATILLGELPRASTSFTGIDPNIDAGIADLADGVVDKGQQSTSPIPADVAAPIALV